MAIPISDIVQVTPGVVGTGGSPISLNSLFLTQDAATPFGALVPFASQAAVAAFYGSNSTEASLAANYFNGHDNSYIKPGLLYFGRYTATAASAWLRGGNLGSNALADVKAIPAGTLTITVDGVAKTTASVNLSAATSLSNAASLISAGFTGGPVVAYDSQRNAFTFTSSTTGVTSTITFGSGALSTGLKLTSATGATLSQGAAVSTPASIMDNLKGIGGGVWKPFMTVFEPLDADKLLFAAWSNNQAQQYEYVVWDSSAAVEGTNNTTCFGYLADQAAYDGVFPIYGLAKHAAFVCGSIASIDFTRRNGRTSFAHRSQSGLTAQVTDSTISKNVIANGYSFYGAYGEGSNSANRLYDGSVPGKWLWLDSYINQVRLNSQLRLAVWTLLGNASYLPYNDTGYEQLRAACQDPIDEGLNFGSIQKGVPLSAQQAAQINAVAGVEIDKTLSAEGFYLQILPATTQTRGLRQSPPVTLWYMDGGSIQSVNLSSIDVL